MPKVGEILDTRMEPENREDKYAVAVIDRESSIVGHLPKGTSGKYAKTVFFFLQSDALNICSVEVTAKAVNLGDGKGMRVLRKLIFRGNTTTVKLLKDIICK